MGARVTLAPTVHAVPGETAVCDLVVENTAAGADVFTFDVDGEPSGWTTVSPRRLPVGGGERGVARVSCRVPRLPEPPAGALILRVDVASRGDPRRPLRAETLLRIASFADVSAALTPAVSSGWRDGDHTVMLHNRGNAPIVATIRVRHVDADLTVTVVPERLTIHPGSAGAILVTATCRRRLRRGGQRRRSFALNVEIDGVPPIELGGEMLQQPRRWLRRSSDGG